MMIVPVALVALFAWAVWYTTHQSSSDQVQAFAHAVPAPIDGAERIAAERLARGEIDVTDYERILAVLRQ